MDAMGITLVEATLCYPIRGGKVLLGVKKKKVCKGKWTGYGGSIEKGERPRIAARRETKEECGLVIKPKALEKAAVINFLNPPEHPSFKVHIYLATRWGGRLAETDEMGPHEWFPIDGLPFAKMMPEDRHWLPRVLGGEKLIGEVWHNARWEVIGSTFVQVTLFVEK